VGRAGYEKIERLILNSQAAKIVNEVGIQGVTVFIPVYNEAAVIETNLRVLFGFLEGLGIDYEVLVGSNGSTDGTVSIIEKMTEKVPALHFFHLPEKGVGAAFREGVMRASFEYLVTVDMDLSINLDFIRRAFGLLESHDLVIGYKIIGDQQRSFIRKAASSMFIALARLLLGIDFHDYSIAAKGYRRNVARNYLRWIDDLTFYVVEIVYRAHRDGMRITEVPVSCCDLRGSRFTWSTRAFINLENFSCSG
jgi:glycosyltransferase involved in cell wall biosynthesis